MKRLLNVSAMRQLMQFKARSVERAFKELFCQIASQDRTDLLSPHFYPSEPSINI